MRIVLTALRDANKALAVPSAFLPLYPPFCRSLIPRDSALGIQRGVISTSAIFVGVRPTRYMTSVH